MLPEQVEEEVESLVLMSLLCRVELKGVTRQLVVAHSASNPTRGFNMIGEIKKE